MTIRQFHVSLVPDIILNRPELLANIHEAGVSRVWIATYFYGHWPYELQMLSRAKAAVEKLGMKAGAILIPLGHPGDSLGSSQGGFPLSPPRSWKLGMGSDGKTYSGTSLHAPAIEENVAAIKVLRKLGFDQMFVDDDFRLSPSPGRIGGCFCDEHRVRFLSISGGTDADWQQLLQDVNTGRDTPLLRKWVAFTCDDLTTAFRAMRKAGPHLGNMVMYLGSEKAGIRLADYAGTPLRVGELMFDDNSFNSVKGKTDELFSALFHRRYVKPEHAYSETTAYPANALSAENMSAKLCVSTIVDVRNTMFMSGLTPFPIEHWRTLGPAMKKQAHLHEQLAGHILRGPFKHFWGEASRYVGTDQPYSLFLACGVPFEVTSRISLDGWTFLSDSDAGAEPHVHDHCVVRSSVVRRGCTTVSEDLDVLFAFRRSLIGKANGIPTDTPYVVEETPAALAWYPTAGCCLVWNLSPESKTLTIAVGDRRISVTVGPLDSERVPV